MLIIFVRILSPEEYGLYVSAFFLLAILDFSTNGFYNQAMVKYLAESKPEESHLIFSTVLYLKLAVLIIFSVIVLLFSPQISNSFGEPKLVNIFILTPFIGFFSILSQTIRFVIVAQKKLRQLFFADILGLLLLTLLFLIIYIYKLLSTSSEALLIFAASNLFMAFSIWIFNRDVIKITFPKIFWVKKLSKFGVFSFLGASSSFLLERFDGILILYFLNPAMLGAYDALRKLSEGIIKNVVNSFRIVFYPDAVIAFNKSLIKVRHIFQFYSLLLFLLCLPFIILLIFFPEFLMKIAYGAKYKEFYYLLTIFGIGAAFRAFTQTGGATVDAMGKPNITFLFTFVCSLIVVGMNLILIPKIGVLGAAISSSSFFVLNAFLLLFYLKKTISISHNSFIEEFKLIFTQYIPKAINTFSNVYLKK